MHVNIQFSYEYSVCSWHPACNIRICFPTNLGQILSRDTRLNNHLILDDS